MPEFENDLSLPWRAQRDTWERAAARAGGFAAEHGAGWAAISKALNSAECVCVTTN
jgi:hypothetical protein